LLSQENKKPETNCFGLCIVFLIAFGAVSSLPLLSSSYLSLAPLSRFGIYAAVGISSARPDREVHLLFSVKIGNLGIHHSPPQNVAGFGNRGRNLRMIKPVDAGNDLGEGAKGIVYNLAETRLPP
jgi:hypothetical protein